MSPEAHAFPVPPTPLRTALGGAFLARAILLGGAAAAVLAVLIAALLPAGYARTLAYSPAARLAWAILGGGVAGACLARGLKGFPAARRGARVGFVVGGATTLIVSCPLLVGFTLISLLLPSGWRMALLVAVLTVAIGGISGVVVGACCAIRPSAWTGPKTSIYAWSGTYVLVYALGGLSEARNAFTLVPGLLFVVLVGALHGGMIGEIVRFALARRDHAVSPSSPGV